MWVSGPIQTTFITRENSIKRKGCGEVAAMVGQICNLCFQCVHTSGVAKMSGPPLKLIVDPTVTPVAMCVPAPVPWHFREKMKARV